MRISAAEVQTGGVWLPDYPDGPRPTSVVRLSGQGQDGFGENVAFTPSDHLRFAARVRALLVPGCAGAGEIAAGNVGAIVRAGGDPYQRAAIEAAVLDLAMRQAGVSFGHLTGVQTAALRTVVSFAACVDPAGRIRRLRAAGYVGDFKVDVDPAWQRATCQALAREQGQGIAILDFKGRGDLTFAGELAALFPRAIFEDPPSGFVRLSVPASGSAPISRDASLGDAAAVAAAVSSGEAVNLKVPRMGGPLELLRGLEHAIASRRPTDQNNAPVAVYFGGMFEVGVGRAQARQLAALYCGEAPNDLASNDPVSPPRPTHEPAVSAGLPLSIRLDHPGFGSHG